LTDWVFCTKVLLIACVLVQIERCEIQATLDTTGTVTFHEDEVAYTTEDVNAVLRDAQIQGSTLSEVDMIFGKSKEFLLKPCSHPSVFILR
jgi:hypothetical protein